MKYHDASYDDLTDFYRYREALVASGEIRAKGTIVAPPFGFIINDNNSHALGRLEKRSITLETAQTYIDNARFALKRQRGKVYAFYSEDGFAVIDTDELLRTDGLIDEKSRKLFDEVVKLIGNGK